LSYNDVKQWLPRKSGIKNILWTYGSKLTEHGKTYKAMYKYKATGVKLMFCWAKEAHERDRITDEQLGRILDNLPKLDVELESPNLAVQSVAIPPSQKPNPDPHPEACSFYDEYAEALIFVKKKREVLDVTTPDAGYTDINVISPEAVFYGKTFNIENQIGVCFKRTQDLLNRFAKDSKVMIEDAVRKKTVFGTEW